jgi:hypothetical protein
MPTIIEGMRDTLDILSARRVVDIMDKIHLLEPDKTPLTILLSKLRRSTAINPEYSWVEDVLMPKSATANGAHTSTDTAIALQSGEGSYFRAHDILKDTTSGEIMKVTSVASDTLTVTRSWGATAAASIADNDELLLLGNASAEGATRPTIKTTKTTKVLNYTQIFREPFGGTRTEEQSKLYGGSDRAYLRRKHMIDHLSKIERAFWFGEKAENTSGSAPRRTTGGFQQFVTTNVTALGTGGLTETTWEDFLRTGFRYGSRTKLAFCSALAIQKINEFSTGKLQTVTGDKTYGINMTKYLSGHGTVMLINEGHVLEGDTYDEYAMLVDLDNVGMKVMQNTLLRPNIQANDADGWEDEYLSEIGFVCRQEKTHAILTNIGGSAVT